MSRSPPEVAASEAVSLAAALVRLPTDGHGEAAAVDLVAPRLEAAGFTVRRSQLATGRQNLEATLPGGDRPILLCGHLDTVPPGDVAWQRPPFSGEIADGWLHGRGSSDMKAGVAALVVAAEQLAHAPPSSGLRVLLTAGEETGCRGALAHLESGAFSAAAILVPEPTDNRLVTAHKGVAWLELTARGRAAHASAPHLGENAIDRIVGTLSRVSSIDLPGGHTLLGRATISIGTIHGGTQTNVVPDLATATVDVRLVPGMKASDVRQILEAQAGPAVDVRALLALDPVDTPTDDPLVEDAASVLARHDIDPQPRGAAYFTDASVLRAASGSPPVIVCGPGDPATAHQTDERCATTRIEQSVDLIHDIVDTWAGTHLAHDTRQ